MKNNKVKIFKLFVFILLLLILLWLTLKILPIFKDILTEDGRINFKNEIQNMGVLGIFTIIGLMIIQVFLAILPGEPVELLAGMCYGTIGGLLIIYVGSIISTSIIFLAVRKFGREFIYNFIEKEKIDKWENSKLFSNKEKLYAVLFVLFFIPGFPKDIFVYLGGLLPVEPSKFIIITSIARFPSIITSTIAGSNIVMGNWNVVIGIYVITFAISLLILGIKLRKERVN